MPPEPDATPQIDTHQRVYEILTGEDQGRVCRDIPDAACREQPRNFLTHVASLAATKTADGLADPKLVLAWLLGAVGAPAFMTGLLVPIREAGALLPQLVIAASIRALPIRKRVWAIGSVVQGIAAIGVGLAALLLEGAAAGWTMLALLAALALARSACSIAHKDVLGKTVSKSTRGTVTGTAGTASAILLLGFGVLLGTGLLERSVGVIAGALFVAGLLWIGGALLFASLAEAPGATEGGGNPLAVAVAQFGLLRDDPQLARFVTIRCLLLATTLAPPFLVAMEARNIGAQAVGLGAFVIASALAAIASSYVWGRLSDVSSRRVIVSAGLIGTVALLASAAVGAGLGRPIGLDVASPLALPALVFALAIAEQGVRLGRTTHVVDMAGQSRRAAYTALSNTITGVLTLGAGVFGLLAQAVGEIAVLLVFAAMAALAVWLAKGLEEVQQA
ncbi:hypothetical protein M6I34_04185 [Burkholderiaceae bacterium FT117]|uniref:hypothetical protein n=1 Tax=Zeimonas sediminis TaxID=2944268 RepID=UPI002342DF90|nr:hypothetical protein [Zeimonas sediminis]MCM5569700.1 hypothetical protein [Zeimonas sediminis]